MTVIGGGGVEHNWNQIQSAGSSMETLKPDYSAETFQKLKGDQVCARSCNFVTEP